MRLVWMVVAATAGAALTGCTASDAVPPSTTTSVSAPAPSPTRMRDVACLDKQREPVRRGVVEVTVGKGLDLDCGRTTDSPDGAGADIAPAPGGGTLLAVDPYAGAAWVDESREDEVDRCAGLPAAEYRKELDGLDQQPKPNRHICVRTSEDNFAVVKLVGAATAEQPNLDVRYLIRYPPA